MTTPAESPRAALPLDEPEEFSFPSDPIPLVRPRPEPRSLAYNVAVQDMMTRRVVSVPPDSTLYRAALFMHRHHVTGLPAIRASRRLVGVVTETDVMRVLSQTAGLTLLAALFEGGKRAPEGPLESQLAPFRAVLRSARVDEAMTPDPVFIEPTATLEEATRALVEHRVNRLAAVEKGRVIGIFTRGDLVRAVFPAPHPEPGPR